jgi:hypothetical protein
MPKIRCSYSKIIQIDQLKPHPRNYNEHSSEQIDLYCEIIKEQGIRRAVTISNLSGNVTRGHGLLSACKKLGYTEIPVDYQDYDSEEQELADIVADNELARLSRINRDKRDSIIFALREKGVDLKLTGLSKEKLTDILQLKKKLDLSFDGLKEKVQSIVDTDSDDSDYDDYQDESEESGDDQDLSYAKQREISNSRKIPIVIILEPEFKEIWDAVKSTKFKVVDDSLAFKKMLELMKGD